MQLKTMLCASVVACLFSSAALADSDYVMLEVGAQKIKKSEVQQVWKSLFPAGEAPDIDTVEEPIKQNVLRGALSEYLLYDKALSDGLEEHKEVKAQLSAAKRKIMVRQFINEKTASLVSDKDVKAAYDNLVRDSRGKQELRARHILMEDEKTAKRVAEKLEKGDEFEALAAEYSMDPGSKTRGGDLGYFSEGDMVEPFEKAALKLDKDEVSEPVESEFGWHIIKLVDKRDVKVPSFTEAKASLRKELAEERLNDFVLDLIDQTDITYYGADGRKKELTNMPDIGNE